MPWYGELLLDGVGGLIGTAVIIWVIVDNAQFQARLQRIREGLE